ncbi:RNA 2',3'-cyclic phosphodiesterase [Nitratifractor sp.]|uniref:2'-5' RNA ligase family protein n=1 Tax=Nitratifractor sp. TaxID=2268144 RepID=UPI0025E8308F|nr:RNA 2',3'-cyclic phosphodiesterase [Nitratifractor sp.]
MRLFIASPVLLYDYTELQRDFCDVIEGKWVEEDKLHLTWIFLGEQPSASPWSEYLSRIAPLDCPALLKGLGSFGRPPRIFHAKSKEPILYHKAMQMQRAGFNFYRFTPHVTLCRIKKITDWRGYKGLLETYREKIIGEIKTEITLYESSLCPDGTIYKKIEAVTT